jgi:hypothetical protein
MPIFGEMARPSKITPERTKKIADLIRAGNYSGQAAQASGISDRSFFRWMEEGEKVSEKCEAWEEAIEEWNELSEEERQKNQDQKPDPNDEPSDRDVAYFQFWREIKKAEAEAEAAAVLTIKKASLDTWQAAAWLLERGRARERWSRQDKVEHAGVVSHAHAHQLLPTAPEAIEEARARLAAARALPSGSQPPESGSSEGGNTPKTDHAGEIGPEEVIEAEVIEEGASEAGEE